MPLSDVSNASLSYSTKQNSAPFAGADAAYQLYVWVNGNSGFDTLTYEPYVNEGNAAIHQGEWQSWNVGQGRFYSSHDFSGTGGSLQTSQGTYTYSLDQIRDYFPNLNIIGFGVNIGSNNPGYVVEADSFAFNGTTYDFEPADYAYPSTNEQNRTAEHGYVDLVSRTTKDVTLKFVNPDPYVMCFEYRSDGDTSQSSGTNYNPAVHDGVYPHVCLTNDEATLPPISAGQYVEVRSTFGAERNTDFDWTRFDVAPDTTGPTIVVNSGSPANGDYLSGTRYTREGQPDQQRNRFTFNITDPGGVWKAAMYVTDSTGNKVKEYALTQHGAPHEDLWYADVDTTQYANGRYQFAVRAVDNANPHNASYFNNRKDSYGVTIDNTRPSIHISAPSDNAYTQGDFTIVGTASDNLSGVDHVNVYVAHNPWSAGGYVVNNQQAVYSQGSGQFTYHATNIPDGTYVVKAVAYDNAGKAQFAETVQITVDNTAPVAQITNPTAGEALSYRRDGTVDIRGTITDNNPDHYYLRITGPNGYVAGPGTVYSTDTSNQSLFSWNLHGLDDGDYVIDLQARDAAGNKDSGSSQKIHVTVDNTRPIITFTWPEDFQNPFQVGPELHIEVTDPNGSGVDSTKAVLHVYNESDNTPTSAWCTGTTCSTSSLVDGNYYVKAGINDLAGNNQTLTQHFTIDSTAPALTINPYAGTDTTPTLTGTTSDVSDVVTVDGASATVSTVANGDGSFDWSYTLPEQTAGDHNVTVVSTDEAGNATQQTATVSVTTPPAARQAQQRILSNPGRGNKKVTVTPNNDGQVLGASTTSDDGSSSNSKGKVKGAETTKNDEIQLATNKQTDDAKNTSSSAFLALGWWWIAVAAALVLFFGLIFRKADTVKKS